MKYANGNFKIKSFIPVDDLLNLTLAIREITGKDYDYFIYKYIDDKIALEILFEHKQHISIQDFKLVGAVTRAWLLGKNYGSVKIITDERLEKGNN